jgi:hypothetical protein
MNDLVALEDRLLSAPPCALAGFCSEPGVTELMGICCRPHQRTLGDHNTLDGWTDRRPRAVLSGTMIHESAAIKANARRVRQGWPRIWAYLHAVLTREKR